MKLAYRKLERGLARLATVVGLAVGGLYAVPAWAVDGTESAAASGPTPTAASTTASAGASSSRKPSASSATAPRSPAPGGAAANAGASAGSSPAARVPSWINVPRLAGRLHAPDLGLIINTADPDSVAVGEHYIVARKLAPEQVLRVDLPLKPTLTREEFERLRLMVETHFDNKIQALALAWTAPYAVECNSITGALAMGFDGDLCRQTCGPSRSSAYFNSASFKPLANHGWRPAMMLAGRTTAQVKALIDRGVAADGALLAPGRPAANVLLLTSGDAARGVRRVLYPPAGLAQAMNIDVKIVPEAELPGAKRVLLVSSGSVHGELEPAPEWLPGGLGDHLTSFGGDLLGNHGQGTALDWLGSGATASHGSVTEPCNHLQKFPHPQVLLLHYLQGATAIEAYWKSVLWPQQSLFVGEPLAAPFAKR